MIKYLIITICSFNLVILVSACSGGNSDIHLNKTGYSFVDSATGSCPNLTKDNDGNIVLSWIRNVTDSNYLFCYARSSDGGKTFQNTITIPGSKNIHPHAENLPKLIFKPTGEVLAVWGASNPNPKNPYSGQIFYAQSLDSGKSWLPIKKLVTDTAGIDQRYFDVALMENGEAAIVWLDNRKTSTNDGSALYFATTDGKNGFQNERLIAQPCCECCRTDLLIEKENIHVVYRAILNQSVRDMVHIVSTDAGKSFSAPVRISKDDWAINGCPHSGPALTANEKGIQFAWYTGANPSGVYYTQSLDNGKSFSQRDTISRDARHPQIVACNNADLVTVWDEPVREMDQSYSRIGVEKRSDHGQKMFSGFLADDKVIATYPVIISSSQNLVLAYCVGRKNETRIALEVISFSD